MDKSLISDTHCFLSFIKRLCPIQYLIIELSVFQRIKDESEVNYFIFNITSEANGGEDTKFKKLSCNGVIEPLTLLINRSLCIGFFAKAFKVVKAIAIDIKREEEDLSKYRATTFLPIQSELFENVM